MTALAAAAQRHRTPDAEFIPDLMFHRSEAPAEHSGELTLTVGGITTRLRGLSSDHVSVLRERYGIFCRDDGRDPFDVAVKQVGRRGFLLPKGIAGEIYRVAIRSQGGVLLATSYEWAGWIDRARRTGGLTLSASATTDPKALDRSIENFLRVLYSQLVVRQDGFLLHAAGLVRGGRAYLFFGPSGAGKTTVAKLSPEATLLSDDLTLVTRSDAPGGVAGACSVPFRGLLAPRPESDTVYPVAGFFRLIQDETDHLVALRGARAIGAIVASLPFVTERPETAGEAIEVVRLAAASVPVFELHFRKSRAFWDVIEASDRAASRRGGRA